MAAACACRLSPWVGISRDVPFLILAFRSVLASAPLCALDPHFCLTALGRAPQQTSTRQSKRDYTRKCGLRGRPRGFRVPFGLKAEEVDEGACQSSSISRHTCSRRWLIPSTSLVHHLLNRTYFISCTIRMNLYECPTPNPGPKHTCH